jgi:hypothetical protein
MSESAEDWREQGQKKYLSGLKYTYKKYIRWSESWDHDHCEFCWEKFSVDMDDALREGWVSEDDYHWICRTCFSRFQRQL